MNDDGLRNVFVAPEVAGRAAAMTGHFELCKTTSHFDSTRAIAIGWGPILWKFRSSRRNCRISQGRGARALGGLYTVGMISAATFATFLSASILLAITPGPGIMYVLARSLAGGRREGILSALGTFIGGFAHVIAAGLGISAVLATSAVAYQVVRWAGASYLIYLGFA